ncbi:MAG: DUF4838 domain-containing protein [Lentisphaeria bacterium]|nr:DUF4838 domain-containing protein [Lentisphaeria bacterium]
MLKNIFEKIGMTGAAGLSAFLFVCCAYSGVQLTEGGKTAYSIVLPADASDNLKYAAHELKIHLEEASGTTFPVVSGETKNGEKQIVLREQDPELETGEFQVRTEGNTLLLSGGGESGIHHAVHDFLETDCGYIWYDARGGKKVPDLKNFKLPEIDRKKKYAWEFRSMSPDYFFHRPVAQYFLYRNGMNEKIRMMPLPGMENRPFSSAGVNDFRRANPANHTFFDYIPDVPGKSRIAALKDKGYFKDHPEWFSVYQDGKRTVRQLCFSNAELCAEFKKNFYEHIRNTPNANVFSVTAHDMPGPFCYCPECEALVKKYQTNGAPVFLFVKELAESVKKDFPNVLIHTFAYRKAQTEFPPEGLVFPDNVVVNFCPIDDDMSKPFDSKTNAETYRNLQKWTGICRHVWLYYYVNPWTFAIYSTIPLGNVRRCAYDTVRAARAGVTGSTYSHPVGTPAMVGFTELQSYLMARLMRDPDLDIEFLIDDFMKFEYGPAAPLMKQYLDELEKVAAETKVFVKWNAVYGVWNSFFKSADAVRWQGYFDEMEKLVQSDPEMLFSVQRVRVPLDILTLRFYRRIKKEVPEYSTSVSELGDRIKSIEHKAAATFFSQKEAQIRKHRENHDKAVDRLVAKLVIQEGTEPKALPKSIFGNIDPALIFEFFPETMGKSVQTEDSSAAWNYTLFNDSEKHGFPLQVLEYDSTKSLWNIFSEIKSAKEGMEGKYCFYHAGTTAITPSMEMRIHFPEYKYLFRIFPGEVWMPGTDDTIDVYVSLKLTGPAYYPGSKEKNSIACDRIVIVRKSND